MNNNYANSLKNNCNISDYPNFLLNNSNCNSPGFIPVITMI